MGNDKSPVIIFDPCGIVDLIEYWDIERQRRPDYEHRAVIVAEQITSRFFNVLRLLTRAVPMIAVQLSAFRLDDGGIVLHPVTVLDVIEEITEGTVVDQPEQVDRALWEKKADPPSLAVMDKIVAALRADGIEPKLTYNRSHVAMGTTGYNFCWFHLRKSPYCHIVLWVEPELRDFSLSSLQTSGFEAYSKRADQIKFNMTSNGFDEKSEVVVDLMKRAEETSRK